jgi:hypothetical protein
MTYINKTRASTGIFLTIIKNDTQGKQALNLGGGGGGRGGGGGHWVCMCVCVLHKYQFYLFNISSLL